METGILERMRLIINHYNLSERQFATRIGVGQPALNTMFHRNQDNIKLTTIVNIFNALPEVSIEWLVIGEGGMLKKNSGEIKSNEDIIKALKTTIDAQQDTILMLKDKVADLEEELDKYTGGNTGSMAG